MRKTALSVASPSEHICERCGATGGAPLNPEAIDEVFLRFFCLGSQAATYLPEVFRPDPEGNYDDITFEVSAQTDYALLKELSGIGLRRHTPRTNELGYTPIRSAIEGVLEQDPNSAPEQAVEELRRNYHTLMDAAGERLLETNELLFRTRIGPKQPYASEEYDSPPVELSVANRVAPRGERMLCAAVDIETCLFETRPAIDDIIHNRIFVASLRPTHKLRLLDFTCQREGPLAAVVEMTLKAFFQANQASYHLTQALSVLTKRRGYDGLVYPSDMQCLNRKTGQWSNVALFGAPVADGRLKVDSINKILVRTVQYNFDLGPVWVEDIEGNHLAPYLKGWIRRTMS
jgi:hypothetical protein